jgi:hypothetical protein
MVIGAGSALSAAVAIDFVGPIEQAHRAEPWRSKGALETRIEVDFGGRRALEGRLVFSSDAARSILEPTSGATAVFDGKTAWVSPNAEAFPGARFHLLTWPYFAAVATKLRDPGTAIEVLGPRQELGRSFDTARLTFAPGTGDAPDDWYVLYREQGSNRLAAMAYIVTFGTDKAKAEAEPHAIVYEDFVDVDGVPVSTRWQFYNWSEQQGIHGDPIGEARLLDPRWVEAPAFVAPAGAVEIGLPN